MPHPKLRVLILFILFVGFSSSCKKGTERQEQTIAYFKGKRSSSSNSSLLIPCKFYIARIEGTLSGTSPNPDFNNVRDYIQDWANEVCNRGHDTRDLAMSALNSFEHGAASYAQGFGLTYVANGPLFDPIVEDCDGTYIPPIPGGGVGTVTLPPLPAPTDTLGKIMLANNLSATQLESLRTLLSRFLSGDGNSEWACIHKQLYRHMVTENLKFNFSMNSNNLVPQSYNPVTTTFSFLNDDSFIFPNIFEHEFFHSYQDMLIGTDAYAVGTVAGGYPDGYTNIEFETALFGDLLKSRSSSEAFINTNVPDAVRVEYNTWLDSITANNTKYPKTFEDFQGKYNYFLKKFKLYSGYADKGEIILDMKPVSLLSLFSTSPCK